MSERKKGLPIGPFHTYAVCADHSQTCTQCEVSVQALARTGAPGSEQGSLLACSALTSPKLPQTPVLFPSRVIAMLLPVSEHGENLADCPQKRLQNLCLASALLLSLLSFRSLNLLAPQQRRDSISCWNTFPWSLFPNLSSTFAC